MKTNMVRNVIKHIKLVSKHKWYVFKFSLKLGIPLRGLKHDMSKFSISEFYVSVKYYDGKISPIIRERQDKGYSYAWLHHKGKNKHHEQYWTDLYCKEAAAVIPYKYAAEMVCDKLSASIVYNGKNWTNASEYEYWMKEKNKIIVNPKVENFFTEVFKQVKDHGIDEVVTKKNIKSIYKKYCIDDKTKYVYEFHGEWKKTLSEAGKE